MNRAYFFLKFGNRHYMELLQNGQLHMKNLDYFIKHEEEQAKKGRGDKYEGAMVLSDVGIQILHPETGEVLIKGKAESIHFRHNDVLTKPVFCMTYIKGEDFEIINETDEYYEAKIKFTDQLKEEMVKEFGDTVLVISAGNFLDRIQEVFEKEDLIFAKGKVDYYDYKVNLTTRIENFDNPMIFFTKDDTIAYQKEFRIAVLNKDVDDHLNIDIGDLSSFSGLTDTNTFLNGDIIVRIMKERSEEEN